MADRYAKNASAVFALKYHLVFCPKYRRPVLTDRVAERLRAVIEATATELGVKVLAAEVMPDHVHLFVSADPTLAPAEIVGRVKGRSSRVLREEFPSLRSRLPTLWTRSYFAGSIGQVSEPTLRRYIEAQKGR